MRTANHAESYLESSGYLGRLPLGVLIIAVRRHRTACFRLETRGGRQLTTGGDCVKTRA